MLYTNLYQFELHEACFNIFPSHLSYSQKNRNYTLNIGIYLNQRGNDPS